MRSLPPLVAGLHRRVLPMADRSAAALAEWLLGADPAQPSGRLAELLARDPPLLLWAMCQAHRQADFPAAGVAEVAGWLAQHALDVLQWPAAQDDVGEEALAAEVWVPRVAAAVTLAELAGRLAGPRQADYDAAVLDGLLYYAGDWLSEADRGEFYSRPADGLPPSVVLATDMLAGIAPVPAGLDIDLEAMGRCGAAAAQEWVAPLGGLSDWLPQVAAHMARLNDLEQRFQETLQQEKLSALAEFAAGAGHEINNPLTVIAGRAQLFLQEETNPERRRALALINAQAMRVYEMIADLRLFARPPQPELQTVALVELVDGLIKELAPAAAQEDIALEREGDAGLLRVVADPTQLSVALRALCQNAIDAIGSGGRIRIELGRGRGEVEIRVRDNGPGIPAAAREHIFDPFYSARQAGRGLGLGLSKCWRIITNHGGRIELEDQPGGGTSFLIRLPQPPGIDQPPG
jgi:nitrogen-specific signal transduction histidine kinase